MTRKNSAASENSLFDFLKLFSSSRLPIIQQAEAAECGVACLTMVANYHGYRASLSELRRRCSVSTKGTTLKALMDMADGLGISSRPVRLEMSELGSLQRPAILHWDTKHYVVLCKVARKKITVHDPAQGIRLLTYDEVSQSFTGVALELTPTPSFKPKKEAETVRLGDLFSRISGLIPSIVQIFLLSIITQAFGLISPMLNQLVVDDAITQGDLSLLTVLAIGMGLLALITATINLLRGFIDLYLGTQLSFQMQTNLLRHTLRLPVSWFEKRHIGDIISRFSSLAPVQNLLKTAATAILLNSLMLIAAVSMMFIYSSFLASIEFVTVFVFFGIRFATFPYFRHKSVESLHRNAQVQTTFLETLRGARTFKLFGSERERTAIWQNEQAQSINTSVQLSRFSLWGTFGTSLLNGIQTIAVWFLGARLVIKGDLTLGMLIAFKAYTDQFSTAASGLVDQFFTFRTVKIHLERLADIIHATPERGIDEEIGNSKRELSGEISVLGMSFRYAEHEPWILKDVSFSIQPGQLACFTGPSGQGKTTLLKLLLGFDDPIEGKITYNDTELRRFGIRHIREQIGVVMQDDHLFSGTVAENISFFEVEAKQEDIEIAAAAAQIHNEIAQLPMGYMTLVGDLGSALSGGQRQRILIARALYRKPKILFLDEGTSNLDPENERLIMEVIRSLPITRIVIAHREAAAAGADCVYDVRHSTVVKTTRPIWATLGQQSP